MNKSNIIKQFNPSLAQEDLKILNIYSKIEDKNNYQEDKVEEIRLIIEEELSKLRNKIIDTDLKLNTSLFADKKFLSETYSFEIPLQENYFLYPERATFKDNILTTKLSKSSLKSLVTNLSINNITARRNTDFRLIDNILYINKNDYYPYQELELNVPNKIISGYLHISFNRYESISILNTYTKEIQDTSVINSITLPITKDDRSFILRFENNENKKLTIKDFYITENSFELNTEILTKAISINQNLKQIGINTCDNYSDPNVNINYYISVNGEGFRDIRPLNKHKNLNLNSILSTDTELHEVLLTDVVTVDNKKLFMLNNVDSLNFHILYSFEDKLGTTVGSTQGNPLYVHAKENINIYLNLNEQIRINDVLFTATSDKYGIILNKGFNKIEVDNILWNQRITLLGKNIISIENNVIKYVDLITQEELSYNINSNETSIFFQLILKASIYLNPIESVLYTKDDILYVIKKSKSNENFIFIKYDSRAVETIQLKINMKTLDKNIPAYISSLTIRGV